MKNNIYSGLRIGLFVFGLSGCANNTVQHAEAPLPIGSSQERARAHARATRVLNPALSQHDAASLAAAATMGEETRAEAEWRQKQKTEAEREKFQKDLDAVTKAK